MGGGALLFLIRNPAREVEDASKSLKAGGEMFALMMIIAALITLGTQRQIFDEHPFMSQLGYNNACVVLDTNPARNVALSCYVFVAYFNILHIKTKLARIKLVQKSSPTPYPRWLRVTLFMANDVFVLATVLFANVFLVDPFESLAWHTAPYSFYLIARWCAVCASYAEYHYDSDPHKGAAPKGAKAFLVLYTIFSIAPSVCWFADYAHYDAQIAAGLTKDAITPLIPWYITGTLDYGLLIFIVLTTKFMPNAHTVVLSPRIVHTSSLDRKADAADAAEHPAELQQIAPKQRGFASRACVAPD